MVLFNFSCFQNSDNILRRQARWAFGRLSELYFHMCKEVYLYIFESKQYFKEYVHENKVRGFTVFDFLKGVSTVYIAICLIKKKYES